MIQSPYVNKEQRREGFRFSDKEIEAVRIFKDNEPALKLLRKVFWQWELTDSEAKSIQAYLTEDMLAVFERLFHPKANWEEPLGEVTTLWLDRKYADLLSAEVKPAVLARQDFLKFIDKGLERLRNIMNGDPKPLMCLIDLDMTDNYEDLPPEEVKRSVVAMQDAFQFLTPMLAQVLVLAGMEKETLEDKEKRLKKDSTK